MDIKILVVAHKEGWVLSNEMYFPIHAGEEISNLDLGFSGDDGGDNISSKNNKYSELTVLYWAWKNLQADAIGLAHYRRYLAEPGTVGRSSGNHPEKKILTKKTAEEILDRVDVILPQKRRYAIETIYSHYDHTHNGEHLRLTGEILKRQCPEYLDTYNTMLKRTSAHMFNMFVMRQEQLCAYCAWLFSILDELDGLVDDSNMTPFECRYVGRIGELLLDVWLTHNQVSYEEVPYVQLGETNWFKKARAFLAAKFRHKKYEESV